MRFNVSASPATSAALRAVTSAPTASSSAPTEHRLHRVDRVGLAGPLVVAVAHDAGEAECDAAWVAGGALDAVEGDLDDLLGPQLHDVVVLDGARADGQLGEPLGLPGEHLVGHALEGLAEHHEVVTLLGCACAEVDVGEPALPAARAPF